jgi:thiol-disulfide isomerase/thioredoxin
MSSARQSIISRLRAGKDVDEWADLCIYPSGSLFVVEFIPPDGASEVEGLTPEQATQLREDGELSEYCETPEEASDLYLMLEERYRGRLIAQKEVFREPDESAPKRAKPAAPAKKGLGFREIDEDSFEEEVGEGVVVVLCWSPWSAPDRMALPTLAKVAADNDGVKFVTLDIAEAPTVVSKLKITATPTAVVIRAGTVHSTVWPVKEDALRGALASIPR